MNFVRLTFTAALLTGALAVPALAADDSTTPAPAPSSTETTTPPPAPAPDGTAAPAPATPAPDGTTAPTEDKSDKDAKGDDKPKPASGGY